MLRNAAEVLRIPLAIAAIGIGAIAVTYSPALVIAQETCACCTGCVCDDNGVCECEECHKIKCGEKCGDN